MTYQFSRNLKAQVSIEFMFGFLAMLMAVSLIGGSLIAQNQGIIEKINDFERINQASAAAAAVQAWLNSGIDMYFDFRDENIAYQIENGRFHVEHESETIEIDGIFEVDNNEPI
ncbi:hypothetical protein KKF81_04550 [Candidatus Micrarchaeota archaeon]|nr:hypothetical protein [Candidatus Micrarchaeota archaeon]MBU1166196.1 hypothetical protein [Candidatus Micrarchaeota archaeon]MBU1887127.1 hypothetical protein [Candidatus Micrarchaeota archaeon]